jgi:hypothetical protein
MDLRKFPVSPWERLRSPLFRRKDLYAIVNKAAIFRMVRHRNGALDYPGGFGLSVDASLIAFFENWGGQTHAPALTVDFDEVPIASGPKG